MLELKKALPNTTGRAGPDSPAILVTTSESVGRAVLELTGTASSAALGELCGRAALAEFFEGHARSGDIRASRVRGELPAWVQ